MTEETKQAEDSQILTDVVLNERIVTHPTRGRIRLRMPTLEVQRKIDTYARAKKKVIRETTDTIPDPETPEQTKTVQAYKSREVLAREYRTLGWWTDENEARLTELTNFYTGYLTQLELLGFESEQNIYDGLSEGREELVKLVDSPAPTEVTDAIFRLTIVGGDPAYEDKKCVSAAGISTEVDEVLAEVEILRKQYDCYVNLAKTQIELMKLEGERAQLFADSWQEQLQYYIRLAQLFYCTENVDTGKSLWSMVAEVEREMDTEFIRWIFGELNAFWQGVSEEARARLEKYSFTRRQSEEKSSSEESPALAPALQDGDLPENEPTVSSEVIATQAP